MRKFILPLLMASVAIPAAAQAQDRDFGGRRDRSEQTDRSDRSERRDTQRSEARERPARNADSTPRFERRSAPMATATTNVEVRRDAERRPTERRWNGGDNRGVTGAVNQIRERELEQRRINDDRRTGDRVRGTTTPTTQTDGLGLGPAGRRLVNDGRRAEDRRDDHRDWRRDGRRDDHRDWRRDWRDNSRYDWRRYRDSNRFVFRIGNYYDPYRYSYRRFNIGYTLWPNYYSSNYWLNDPWMYRLPPAYGPYRWVRYYDDALLVNIYTGQVVDVIYSVFW
jgi:Ni/Co efflux regulator RcnB